MTDELREQVKSKMIEMLANRPSVQSCCKQLGIGRATFYRWLETDSEFRRKINESIKDGVFEYNGRAEQTILDMIDNGNMTAIIFWLKRRHSEYMPISRLDRKDTDEDGTVKERSDSVET